MKGSRLETILLCALLVLMLGYLINLWPLPSTIALETVRASQSPHGSLTDAQMTSIANSLAIRLWIWWACYVGMLTLGAFTVRRVSSKRSWTTPLTCFLLAGALLSWTALFLSSYPTTYIGWQVELFRRFLSAEDYREAFIVIHRLVALVVFSFGAAFVLLPRTRALAKRRDR